MVYQLSLFDLTSQRVDLGQVISFDDSTVTSVSTFDVTPAALSQFIQFSFEDSSMYIDYESLNRLDGDFARTVTVELVLQDANEYAATKQFYIFVLQGYDFKMHDLFVDD